MEIVSPDDPDQDNGTQLLNYCFVIGPGQSSLTSRRACGRDNRVIKVTDSWPACHEFEPSTAEDTPCKGAMHVKSVETQTSSCSCGGVAGLGLAYAKRTPFACSKVWQRLNHGMGMRSRAIGFLRCDNFTGWDIVTSRMTTSLTMLRGLPWMGMMMMRQIRRKVQPRNPQEVPEINPSENFLEAKKDLRFNGRVSRVQNLSFRRLR
ncbi:hypothetical protein TNCV_3957191 [Trichonephila clavipes]|nr:hypothetical protein TNCV_3957191 [Trichonephila clavipes]